MKISLFAPDAIRRKVRFIVTGGLGFTVDAMLLASLVDGIGFDPFSARLISFSVALVVTWILNRNWVFVATKVTSGWLVDFLNYIKVQLSSVFLNYLVYSIGLFFLPEFSGRYVTALFVASFFAAFWTYFWLSFIFIPKERDPAP